MKIKILDKEFVACLQSEGTVVFLNTWYPTQGDLEVYPHNEMTSCHHWNPHQIQFPKTKYGVQEKIEGQNVAVASICFSGEVSRDTQKVDTPMKDLPTVSATTRFTSANGRIYILVFDQALYMKDMEHTLINPNQWQNFGA